MGTERANTTATYYLIGPTAVGKSELAVCAAEALDAEIVGCDAYQIYRGLPILTAQPTAQQMARVPHHLIGEIDPQETMDVGRYLALARQRIQEIAARGKRTLVVGGNGMYFRALTRGLANLPAADPKLRSELEALTTEALSARLKALDPVGYASIDRNNPRRLVRAVEICLLTQRPYSESASEWKTQPLGCRGVLLERSKEELNRRIEARVQSMFEEGVMEEAKRASLISRTASQTLGYRELQAVIAGELSQEEAALRITIATRQYAKRQATWFRREEWLTRFSLKSGSESDQQNCATVCDLLTRPAQEL